MSQSIAEVRALVRGRQHGITGKAKRFSEVDIDLDSLDALRELLDGLKQDGEGYRVDDCVTIQTNSGLSISAWLNLEGGPNEIKGGEIVSEQERTEQQEARGDLAGESGTGYTYADGYSNGDGYSLAEQED